MKKYKIPNMKEILKPRWAHKPGWRVNQAGWHKMKILKQATVPDDRKILQKLGIKKGEKVLAIAGYYGNWASALKKTGAIVSYSDISKPIVNWVKKNNKTKFKEYICSNYELIPKKPKKYDWTFTFEACGGGQGLPLAYLRSLLNNKGGILVLYWNTKKRARMGIKPKRYPLIVKSLAKAYGAKASIKEINVKTYENFPRKDKKTAFLPHKIYTIKKSLKFNNRMKYIIIKQIYLTKKLKNLKDTSKKKT